MVRLFNLILFSIIAISLPKCTLDEDLTFFNVNQVLEKLQNEELEAHLLPFDLVNILYLDTGLIKQLREVAPIYISQKNLDLELFFIDVTDKDEIQLTSKYQSVEEVVTRLDSSIKHYLEKSFGIGNVNSTINKNVLILNNKAFIELVGEGSVYALTFELLQETKVRIGIAYIIID